jgi:hypothetical protein
MSKYKDWKMLDWIIGGIGIICIISEPTRFFEPSLYSNPYKIPQMVVGVFLIYCFLSVIYWIINKKINMAIHYFLIVAIYIAITILYVVAVNSGM